MPNSARQHQNDVHTNVPQAPVAGAEHATESGSQSPRDSHTQAAAGELLAASQRKAFEDALQLLTTAVRALERSGRSTAAAGVGAKMRQLDRTFALKNAGLKSFRDLLDAAVGRRLIELDRAPDDYVVRLTVPDAPPTPTSRPRSLRRDLWSAILDWSPDARYAFNRLTRATERVQGEITPDQVLAPTLSKEHHVQWMADFAATEIARDDQSPLVEALSADDPAATFAAALGGNDSVSRRWKRHLRHRIIDRALAWSQENHVPVADISAPEAVRTPEPAAVAHPNMSSDSDDDQLREQILSVLHTLPLHELLRLRIPVGYTLRR